MIVAAGICCVIVILAVLFLTGTIGGSSMGKKDVFVVGTDIALADVTEFYYTYATSTYPPEYQRYHFFVEEGQCLFYHEQREGYAWPLTEEHITVSGRVQLSEKEWAEFFDLLKSGSVKSREESIESGGSGPWLYLYWNGDDSNYQEFSFASPIAEDAFEEHCIMLKNSH